jgi:hypothetical protein
MTHSASVHQTSHYFRRPHELRSQLCDFLLAQYQWQMSALLRSDTIDEMHVPSKHILIEKQYRAQCLVLGSRRDVSNQRKFR